VEENALPVKTYAQAAPENVVDHVPAVVNQQHTIDKLHIVVREQVADIF
jgi:hypothetical protein